MADDIPITGSPGGTPVATDELAGGRHAQLMKVIFGTDGIGTMVSATDPFPTTNALAIPTAPRLGSSAINVSTSGDTTLLAGTVSQTIRVWKVFLVVTAAVTLKFKDGATDFSPGLPMVAGGSITLDFDGEPWFPCASGNAFVLNLSTATQVSGRFYYTKS